LKELKKNSVCDNFSDDRFLMACLFGRKLDVKRTVEMLEKNWKWRTKKGYEEMPRWEDLNHDLFQLDYFWTVPSSRAFDGTGIQYTCAKNFFPGAHSAEDLVKNALWIHGILLLMEGMDLHRHGMTLVMDLEGVGWKNFDYSHHKIMQDVFMEKFPMRPQKILIVHPPYFIGPLINFFKLFTKSKILKRVEVCYQVSDIQKYIDKAVLPKQFEGDMEFGPNQFFNYISKWGMEWEKAR